MSTLLLLSNNFEDNTVMIYNSCFFLNTEDCGAPGPIDNGNITEAVIGETTLFSKAIVSCDTGYNKTSSSVTCQPDGLWSEVFCNITGKTSELIHYNILEKKQNIESN
jgi:hypothetical protein